VCKSGEEAARSVWEKVKKGNTDGKLQPSRAKRNRKGEEPGEQFQGKSRGTKKF